MAEMEEFKRREPLALKEIRLRGRTTDRKPARQLRLCRMKKKQENER
jgi:hypothetical protein